MLPAADRAQSLLVIPEESRFETDPDELVDPPEGLPAGWEIGTPDPTDRFDVARLTRLLRAHESHGRGWPGSGVDDVLVEVSEQGLRTRENVVVRDDKGEIRAWGSVHDRAGGRMLFLHIVERDLPEAVGRACSDVLVDWAVGQARAVGAARGLEVQQIDTGAFADDDRQHRWLEAAGFERVRTWWQMSRPVAPDEADLVPSPDHWESERATFRLVRRAGDGMPDETDLRELHEVLEGAFVDHFNSREETFDEFLHRLREDPGHRWDHWWLAEIPGDNGDPQPVGALIGTVSESMSGPDGSYVSYLGVLESARGRGVAKGLLHTIIADAAARGRDRVGLEVDADSPTGASELYTGMGWITSYVTESWHRDVPVD
ncbi:MAG TPA: GNAT family N-acetyltransferase [Nocardioides sp.]|nr:GNAT family N-acetyltransferase [Nocardioides sp.]